MSIGMDDDGGPLGAAEAVIAWLMVALLAAMVIAAAVSAARAARGMAGGGDAAPAAERAALERCFRDGVYGDELCDMDDNAEDAARMEPAGARGDP